MLNIDGKWNELLKDEFSKEYFIDLRKFVEKRYQFANCFPPYSMIFRAFELCPFENTRVVILGQDPYHQVHQAHGLSFSVEEHVSIPPSLKNIFKEIQNELDIPIPENGDLSRWAQQGVLLLNSVMSVEESKPGSHRNKGWEHFTDRVISCLNERKENVVYFLWGSYAQKKGKIIDRNKNLVLESPHPSPLSSYRGFFGTDHFIECNAFLKNKNSAEIQW